MPISYQGGSGPREPYAEQRNIEDGFVEAEAMITQEHDAFGAHTHITALSLDQARDRSDALLEMRAGLRFLGGPWAFEGDGGAAPLGGGAVLRAAPITANQNNYAPDGIEEAVILELESDAARTITGISRGALLARRRFLYLVNRGNFTLTLAHNSGSSVAGNRIAVSGGQDFVLRTGGVALGYYDSGSEIWRVEGGPVTQVRSVQRMDVTFASGGGVTQNYALGTTLADYTKAVIVRCSSYSESSAAENAFAAPQTARLTSNTNLRITGSDTQTRTMIVEIVEYQNL
ncbi:MAG: hypothetical protein GEV06_19770 [Luteitalea sp.]|nr:hypothetical protein [Luteitalea sp.]